MAESTIDLDSKIYSATELSIGFDISSSHLHGALRRIRDKGVSVPGETQDESSGMWSFTDQTARFLAGEKGWSFDPVRIEAQSPTELRHRGELDSFQLALDDAVREAAEATGRAVILEENTEESKARSKQMSSDLEHERSQRERSERDLETLKIENIAVIKNLAVREAELKATAERAERLETELAGERQALLERAAQLNKAEREVELRRLSSGWWSRRKFDRISPRGEDDTQKL